MIIYKLFGPFKISENSDNQCFPKPKYTYTNVFVHSPKVFSLLSERRKQTLTLTRNVHIKEVKASSLLKPIIK